MTRCHHPGKGLCAVLTRLQPRPDRPLESLDWRQQSWL